MTRASPPWPVLTGVLAVAVVGVSLAAPILEYRTLDALATAFWRMALSTVLTGGLWAAGRGRRDPSPEASRPGDTACVVLGGACLAAHFAAWIASLDLTSIAASVTLVNLQPVFAALLAAALLGERLSFRRSVGLCIALAGALVISVPSLGDGGGALSGNLLALFAAFAGAGYYVAGRHLRPRTSIWAYVTRVYGTAAAVLLAMAAAGGSSLWPLPKRDILVLAGLVLGPTLLGHTLLNWSLRWLPAPAVNTVALGEPVGAALFGWLLHGEVPAAATVAGGAVVLAGIAVVLRGP